MSKFSMYCKHLLSSNNLSIYQLSKQSGLERTALHRMVNGKQVPSQEFFEKFCSSLRIGIKDRGELSELYLEEKIGREKYFNRRYIREMIEHIADFEQTIISLPDYEGIRGETLLSDCKTLTHFPASNGFQTKMLLSSVLTHSCFSPQVRPILTNLPSSFSFFFQCMNDLCRLYKKRMEVRHFLVFHGNPHTYKNVNCNLEILRDILPIALSSHLNYMPYYSYSQTLPIDIDFIPWPYYLVTDSHILLLSGDLKNAVLHSEKEMVDKYHAMLTQLAQNMQPFIRQTSDALETIEYYKKISSSSGKLTYALKFHPCITKGLPVDKSTHFLMEFFHTHVHHLTSDVSMLENTKIIHFLALLSQGSPTFYFSITGLKQFCETGAVTGQIGTFFPVLSLEERIQVLKTLLSLNNGVQSSIFLCKENVPLPRHILLEMYGQKTLLFLKFNTDLTFQFVCIEESSICEAFLDFFSSFSDHDNVFGIEETNQILRNCINEIS